MNFIVKLVDRSAERNVKNEEELHKKIVLEQLQILKLHVWEKLAQICLFSMRFNGFDSLSLGKSKSWVVKATLQHFSLNYSYSAFYFD